MTEPVNVKKEEKWKEKTRNHGIPVMFSQLELIQVICFLLYHSFKTEAFNLNCDTDSWSYTLQSAGL